MKLDLIGVKWSGLGKHYKTTQNVQRQKPPPGWLIWIRAGVLSRRLLFQTPALTILRVF